MSQHAASAHRQVPVAIRVIAALYYFPILLMLCVFIGNRLTTSLSLAPDDAVTIPMILIPAVSLWPLYRPNRFNRWLPFLGIPLIWIIVFPAVRLFGQPFVQGDDVSDIVVGAWFFSTLLTAFTVYMVIPALLLLCIPSARKHLFCAASFEAN